MAVHKKTKSCRIHQSVKLSPDFGVCKNCLVDNQVLVATCGKVSHKICKLCAYTNDNCPKCGEESEGIELTVKDQKEIIQTRAITINAKIVTVLKAMGFD
jgi:hypothetical protein